MQKFRTLDPVWVLVVLLAITLLSGRTATAQVPTSADPGIIGRHLESPTRGASRLEDTIVIPEDSAEAALGSDQKVFVLKSIVLEGASVYTAEDFAEIYEPYIGQKVSFADLNQITRSMTRKYREDGYIFSRIILPPQKVTGGALKVQAVEGRVANVQVIGAFEDKNGLIQQIADKIQATGPANTKDIERYLLLIDDLPGITARSFMKPSAAPGATDLVIAVEQDFFEGSAMFENRGSRYVGPWRGELMGAFNSLFGMHDRTTVRALAATQLDELLFGEITHEEQLGAEGFRLKGSYSVTKTEPGGRLSSNDIQGDSSLFGFEGLYPLIRGRQMNWNFVGAFTANNTTTELAGSEIAKDHIRHLRAGSLIDFTDPLQGINQLELFAYQGLDIFGATADGLGRSRGNGEHSFRKYTATVTRIQGIPTTDFSVFLLHRPS